MKFTGVSRKLDPLGRIVLPMEIRRAFDIKENDPLEIYVENDAIILKKHSPSCIFCGDAKDVMYYMNKAVCPNCQKQLAK